MERLSLLKPASNPLSFDRCRRSRFWIPRMNRSAIARRRNRRVGHGYVSSLNRSTPGADGQAPTLEEAKAVFRTGYLKRRSDSGLN
jgi:hypothetical protein